MPSVPTTDADRLLAAQIARHQLLTGSLAETVEVEGGMKVTFSAANREALEAYISELDAKIAGRRTRGAVGVIF